MKSASLYDTPEAVRQAERWQVPNKLTDRRRADEVALLLRWKLPSPCPGPHELASEVVEAGQPAPDPLCRAGYAVAWIFPMIGRSGAGVTSAKPPPVEGI